jgi:TetR/AcrR family transcriptional regulator, regulator of mycofactocin system
VQKPVAARLGRRLCDDPMIGEGPIQPGTATLGVRGRPPSTTRAQVSRTALGLFVARGFEETTLADIAAALGIGRRTLFRYFPSKAHMVWGEFEIVLARLRSELEGSDPAEPAVDVLTRAVIAANHHEGEALEDLRRRMQLIIDVPALQAHSALHFAEWQRIVARFVAGRVQQSPHDIVPLFVAHTAFATSMAAFLRWVRFPDESLEAHLRAGYDLLGRGVAAGMGTGVPLPAAEGPSAGARP